jgi:hypothetical protein
MHYHLYLVNKNIISNKHIKHGLATKNNDFIFPKNQVLIVINIKSLEEEI